MREATRDLLNPDHVNHRSSEPGRWRQRTVDPPFGSPAVRRDEIQARRQIEAEVYLGPKESPIVADMWNDRRYRAVVRIARLRATGSALRLYA